MQQLKWEQTVKLSIQSMITVERSHITVRVQVNQLFAYINNVLVLHYIELLLLDFYICVKVMLENGADVNIKDNEGKTILDIANEKGEWTDLVGKIFAVNKIHLFHQPTYLFQ